LQEQKRIAGLVVSREWRNWGICGDYVSCFDCREKQRREIEEEVAERLWLIRIGDRHEEEIEGEEEKAQPWWLCTDALKNRVNRGARTEDKQVACA
jgi:hypothetical protein